MREPTAPPATPPTSAAQAAPPRCEDPSLPPSSPPDAIDPYLGFFFVGRPVGDLWLLGGDIRVSQPFVELIPRVFAMTLGLELGALYGTQYVSPDASAASGGAPSFTLDMRTAVLLGARARIDGWLSLGVRAGYSLVVSQTSGDGLALVLRDTVQAGIEVGIGTAGMTFTGGFDLLVTLKGDVLPLLAAGLCF